MRIPIRIAPMNQNSKSSKFPTSKLNGIICQGFIKMCILVWIVWWLLSSFFSNCLNAPEIHWVVEAKWELPAVINEQFVRLWLMRLMFTSETFHRKCRRHHQNKWYFDRWWKIRVLNTKRSQQNRIKVKIIGRIGATPLWKNGSCD